MLEDIHIRTVAVELLRAGPAHNQLLSPLTQYLGVCDDAEAGLVMLPYEQHTFMRRMRAMRHDDKAVSDDKLPDLRDLGVEMAKLLGAIPRLPGALGADPRGKATLVRLSLTLSASELAGLPFELAKVPLGPNSCTESWLSLQARVPVVITRRTRNVSTPNLRWLHCPRILFIASNPKGTPSIPFKEHRKALIDAVTPFISPKGVLRRPAGGDTPDKDGLNQFEDFGDLLTILSNASFDEVVRECGRTPYTHIHILAHGNKDESQGDRTHGLALHEKDGVISGERLASAFACLLDGALHRPQVVTLATCDSGDSSDVVNPGASIAHVLHQAGIPLVVASQVPLSKPASILFTREFYRGLLWGEHPWVLMHRVRSNLHGHLRPVDHDWASLVVYEALPLDLTRELEGARFRQCQRAMEVAFYPDAPWPDIKDPIDHVIGRLPVNGKYFGMESLALRADGRQRNAHIAFMDSLEKGMSARDRLAASLDSLYWLEQALVDYTKAVNGFLVSPGQGMNAPYRTLVAQLAILVALGKKFDWGMWHMAKHWVDCTLEESADPEEKVRAQGCTAELWLLRMLDPQVTDLDDCRTQALHAIRSMMRLIDRSDEQSTGQSDSATAWMDDRLYLYADWFSKPHFEEVLHSQVGTEVDRPSWGHCLEGSVASQGRKLQDVLRRTVQASARDAGSAPDERNAPQAAGKAKAKDKTKDKTKDKLDDQPKDQPKDRPKNQPDPDAVAEPVAQAPAPAAAAAPETQLLGAQARVAASRAVKPAKKAVSVKAPSTAPASTVAVGTRFSIEMLAADQGDALWVEWGLPGGPTRRLLVDCGTTRTWGAALKPRIQRIAAPDAAHFELFILSHIDSDHIEGSLPLLREAQALGVSFGEIWFNGRKHLGNQMGATQAEAFSKLLAGKSYAGLWNKRFEGGAVLRPDDALPPAIALADGMRLTLLSPVQDTLDRLAPFWDSELKNAAKSEASELMGHRQLEPSKDITFLANKKFESDPSRPNGSSIAVLAEFQGKSLLLAADVYAPVLEQAVDLLRTQRGLPADRPLQVDAFKLSHHGSRNNLSVPLMKKLQARHYLVSTNGDRHKHPDREAIARVLKHGGEQPKLWFNYLPEDEYHRFWFEPATQARHGYTVEQPSAGQAGTVLNLF